jgi:hypothetical protein
MGGPAHPSPSTADLAALHAKANWLTVPVAGPSIAVVAPRYHHGLPRARILEAQQKQFNSLKGPGSAGQNVLQLSNELAPCYLHREYASLDPTVARRPRVLRHSSDFVLKRPDDTHNACVCSAARALHWHIIRQKRLLQPIAKKSLWRARSRN